MRMSKILGLLLVRLYILHEVMMKWCRKGKQRLRNDEWSKLGTQTGHAVGGGRGYTEMMHCLLVSLVGEISPGTERDAEDVLVSLMIAVNCAASQPATLCVLNAPGGRVSGTTTEERRRL
jgi:hypothetical protein